MRDLEGAMTAERQVGPSDLVGVLLTDYQQTRDEIRMRITQRHNFTNYALFLFAAAVSLVGVVGDGDSDAGGLHFFPMDAGYLFLVLVFPPIFYALLMAHLRHDYYIVLLTVYLERQIGAQIRAVARSARDLPPDFDPSALLCWERTVQSYRESGRGSRRSPALVAWTDLVFKHSPFLIPAAVFLAMSFAAFFYQVYHPILYVLFGCDVLAFLYVGVVGYRTLEWLMEVRGRKIPAGRGNSAEETTEGAAG